MENICPFCDQPLSHDSPYLDLYHVGGIINGLHNACNCQLMAEMDTYDYVVLKTMVKKNEEIVR